jgi:hypothetical protein
VRVLANQILNAATKESLPVLPPALQQRLGGTTDDLRTFLKNGVLDAWTTVLRISVVRTLSGAGAKVHAAAQKALDDETIDAYLAFLNDGLYAARALDCASSHPTATPSQTPTATTTAAAVPPASAGGGASGGEGGGLPVTGSDTVTVAGIGVALLLIGGAGDLMARRRRSRFVA